MNAPVMHEQLAQGLAPLNRIALALLPQAEGDAPEAQWLRTECARVGPDALQRWRAQAPATDQAMAALVAHLQLHPAEALGLALALEVEFDPMLARALAWLQAPVGAARPTLGLLCASRLGSTEGLPELMSALLEGAAQASGVLQWCDQVQRPMPERSMSVPLPLALALKGRGTAWPGARELRSQTVAPPSLQAQAAAQAAVLRQRGGLLVVRSGQVQEALFGAERVAHALGLRAVAFEGVPTPGAGPWLWLRGALPVLKLELAPGEVRRLKPIAGYGGPLLVVCGHEGVVELDAAAPAQVWRVPLPSAEERRAHWAGQVAPQALEQASRLRFGTLQIQALAASAQGLAAQQGRTLPDAADLRRAAREGLGEELGALAQRVDDEVLDEAMVLTPALRQALDALASRCQRREALAQGLGPAAQARYRPGVRALFSGPSGTGKTLAAAWLATRLGLPLYRVDLAAVTSKYIGETEKQLAQLFNLAEQAELVLLFDEADALFGKRTEVKDSNDRFANQQTNYLLQRIEAFAGIVLLTSNARGRFDSAFARRLDAAIEFPAPGPEARADLWRAHLGANTALDDGQINRIAAACDLAGGHIRNASLAAAGLSQPGQGPGYAEVCLAMEAEYRKLGRALPPLS